MESSKLKKNTKNNTLKPELFEDHLFGGFRCSSRIHEYLWHEYRFFPV